MEHIESKYIYELSSEWLAYVRHRFSKHTFTGYKRALQRLQQAVPDKYEDLTPQRIEQFLQAQTLSANSINTTLTAIKSFGHWCEKHYGLPNPARKVEYLKREPFKQRVLTSKELQKVVAVAKPNTKAVLLFLANTGLRVGELRSLKSENISPDKRLMHITGKGGKQRAVPLNRTALEYLPTVLNFTKSWHNYYEIFHCVARKAKVEEFGAHALRHYYATELAKSIPICLLSKLLGHANVLITQTIYVHLSDNDLIGKTDVLDRGTQ